MAAALQVVVGASGRELELPPRLLLPGISTSDLRAEAAAQLGIHTQQVVLLIGEEELHDSPRSDGKLAAAGSGTVVTVLTRPCRAKPSEYGAYIVECKGKEKVTQSQKEDARSGRDIVCNRAFVRLGEVAFPPPSDININMMPFIIGEEDSIPAEYQQYWPLICRCPGLRPEKGKVGYLTIQESEIPAGSSQRRPGIHTESPGSILALGGRTLVDFDAMWGGGHTTDGLNLEGGIYMASTVGRSCRVWKAVLTEPRMVVGHLGSVEHLRPLLEKVGHTDMDADELFWITDTTPHESLPLKRPAFRQYFRLVTSSVSVWYERHSTKNRLGIEPDPKVTRIIAEDKFLTDPWDRLSPLSGGAESAPCAGAVAATGGEGGGGEEAAPAARVETGGGPAAAAPSAPPQPDPTAAEDAPAAAAAPGAAAEADV